jgi:uncharacterized protein YkwD
MSRLLGLIIAVAVLLLGALADSASAAYEDLLAPETACANQSSTSLSVDAQETSMLCMVNYARTKTGARALTKNALLMDAADRKAQDMVRCNQFSHTACGLPFDQRIRDAGYLYAAAGENIAWGSGSYGTVRQTMTNWLNSTGHRTNLLSTSFRDQGIGLAKTTFQGYPGAQIWVNELAAPRA